MRTAQQVTAASGLFPRCVVRVPWAVVLVASALAPVARAKVVDCTGSAQGIFGNLRIPASLLAGAAMGSLWTPITARAEDKRACNKQTLYTILVALAVTFELVVVFVTTAMGNELSGGGFDPMANNGVEFLVREFELTYLSTRLCFFSGILCFVASLAIRASTSFAPELSRATTALFTSVGCLMLAAFNTGADDDYFFMFKRVLYLATTSVALEKPFRLLAALSALASAYCVLNTLNTQVIVHKDKRPIE